MMSLILLAAASVVIGDFDHDGLIDRAYIRNSAGARELVVKRGTGQIVVIDRVARIGGYYFDRLLPGDVVLIKRQRLYIAKQATIKPLDCRVQARIIPSQIHDPPQALQSRSKMLRSIDHLMQQ